ncbi:hypothetical protein BH23GEM9_BH23GEM9_33560 [soil metagenome]
MHTEHLQNVSISQVIAGWLIAAAVASLVALALVGTGVITDDPTAAGTWWSMLAIAAGFLAGGFFTGFRAIQAPILHAAAIGFTSIVIWFLLNALAALAFRSWSWPTVSPQFAVGVILLQFVAAAIGALLGYNLALRGRPGLSEHEPV